VDAGAGAMQALGARLLDADGIELPPGGAALASLERIDLSACDPRLIDVDVTVASDVTNPLYGPRGAAFVFGPQKGAAPDDVRGLDAALANFAAVVRRDLGIDLQGIPGSGAAGGLGCGLIVAAGARIVRGFDVVAEACELDRRIAAADAVVTGEGRLDDQTPYGKTAAGVAAIARRHGKRVICIAGTVHESFNAPMMFDAIESAAMPGMAVEEAMRRGAALVCDAAKRAAERLR
jgi:glycerate kinase